MKIAMIGQKGIPAIWGGVERHVEELALRLAQTGHSVTAYCRRWYYEHPEKSYRGVNLHFTPSLHTKNLDAITHTFLATLSALHQDFDIIHYHGVGPALLAWIPRIFKPSAKVVVTFHCVDRLHSKWGILARLMLYIGEFAACKFPHQTIVVSQTLKNYVKEKYNCEAIYIPNGITARNVEVDAKLLKQFELIPNHFLLAVSRLLPHKSIHFLIEAFRLLKLEKPKETAHLKLAIVGDGSYTDDYVRFLHEMAHDTQGVVFAGWQKGPELEALFANAKLFVHPSQSEGLPLVVLEAMSYSRPAVLSDIPEHQELVSDQRFLYKHDQINELKRTLEWALANPEICLANGIQNRLHVEKDYNWDTIAEHVAKAYAWEKDSPVNLPLFTTKKLAI
jgi:glycosyltransferase involved in cell wall biosynthesis